MNAIVNGRRSSTMRKAKPAPVPQPFRGFAVLRVEGGRSIVRCACGHVQSAGPRRLAVGVCQSCEHRPTGRRIDWLFRHLDEEIREEKKRGRVRVVSFGRTRPALDLTSAEACAPFNESRALRPGVVA